MLPLHVPSALLTPSFFFHQVCSFVHFFYPSLFFFYFITAIHIIAAVWLWTHSLAPPYRIVLILLIEEIREWGEMGS